MMRKVLSVILAVLMVLSAVSVSAFAVGYTETEASAGTPVPEIIHREYIIDEYGAEKRVEYDSEGNIVENESNILSTASASLPSSYDARTENRVTSVKNQSPFGTCWSFAYCSAAESSLISQGYETKDSVDLSEAHLAWFRLSNYVAGSSIPAQQDRRISTTGESAFEMGGNIEEATAAVARWSGFVKEEDYPYSDNEADMQFPVSTMFDNDYNLTSAVIYSPENTSEIKQAIMKNGALATAIYYDGKYEKITSNYSAYYQPVTSGTNHAVTCIGWDDNFPASNFKYLPEGNGAWLIKNSWGPYMDCDGYLWVSYYDPSLGDFGEINAKPSGDYDHNYQYDGQYELYAFSLDKYIYGSNIFTAEGDENVKACGFWAYNSSPYEITATLYTGLTNVSKPTSGTLCESKTINTSHEGYYTVDFNGSYPVSAGEKFAVVLKVKNTSGGAASIPFEYDSDYYTYSYDVGQSFYSDSGYYWYDMAESGYGNIPIKAFTSDYSEPVVSPKAGKDTVIDDENGFIYGLDFGIKSLDSYITVADGYTYSCTGFGTGGKVNVFNGSALVKTYEIVIFGDVNGDGWADGTDAVLINCYAGGLLTQGDDAFSLAADCNRDGQIDTLDFELAQNAGVLINEITQSDDPLQSASYQEYSQIIPQVTVTKTVTGENVQESNVQTAPTVLEILINFITQLFALIFRF